MKETVNVSLFSYENVTRALAASAGSVVAMVTFYPLETVRSRLQLEDRESKNSWKVIKELVKEEGVETLYRGIIPVLESICTSNFVYFYTFHGLRYLRSNESRTAAGDLLFASIAGIVNVLTTTPLWVVNTRMKMEGVKKNINRKYKSLLDGLIKIKKEEGLSALWNGTVPSLLLVSNPAIQLMVYESVKRHIQKLTLNGKLGTVTIFLAAAFSKSVATVLTYPLQLVQTKLRHGHDYKDLSSDVGTIGLILYLLRKQGVPGLYKGMEAKLLQTVLTTALMFMTYEKITRLIFGIMGYRNGIVK
ncbi:UNVERIFIED_CONTAM: hypothetical protein PYX00_007944 [Menopon gallinae]|uniref:Peroxisomal membrane protein PMP34 n=1 Tax=Menopon gallinae TaxID=328185 RepID=A0AAW2HLB0_9NEOP